MARKTWKRKLAEQHIKRIARTHKVHIRWVKGPKWMDKAESSETARLVSIPRPYTPRQYLVCLHELGHILGKITYRGCTDHLDWGLVTMHLVIEASADAWAMEHVHPELIHCFGYEDVEKTVGIGFAHHAWSSFCADLNA